jgi:multisubunit Na+/H+ antiporter MnhE subunit
MPTLTTFAIYCYLFAGATTYAVLLAYFRHFWEPDLTWLEVIVGVMLCLIAPYADQRANGPLTSELYEQRVWLAFVIGGLPIVLWQIGKSTRARLQVERRIRGTHGNTRDATDRPEALADHPGEAPETRD